MIKFKVFSLLPDFETNTYLVWEADFGQTMLIDPSMPSESVIDFVNAHHLQVKYIINTHGHADHIGGNKFFHERLGAEVCIHSDDAEMLLNAKSNLSAFMDYNLSLPAANHLLQDNDILSIDGVQVRVIHTPGHTKGGICLLIGEFLFSGDTLFRYDIGRTDLPGGSESQIVDSIRDKLFALPGQTRVFPGHGPDTTIQDEKQNNPYV